MPDSPMIRELRADYGGPYLAGAFFCEKLLDEKDDVVSAIRIIDRVMIGAQTPNAPADLPPGVMDLTLVMLFKSGQARGRQTVQVVLERPNGLREDPHRIGVLFEGEDRGANVIFQLRLGVQSEGLHWFDVFVDDHFMTRVPLRVVYQPSPTTRTH